MAIAAPARSAPVLLEGERVALVGTERTGVTAFVVDGKLVASGLTSDAGVAANVIVAPGTLRRELVGVGASAFESTLATPALPLGAVQWNGSPRTHTVEMTLLPGAPDTVHHVHPEGVRVAESGSEEVVEALFHPAPTRCDAVATEGGGVRVRATLDTEGAVTLLLTAGTPDRVARTVAAVPHLASHEIRAAAAGDPARTHTLSVRSGVPEMDDAVAWATARIQASLRRAGEADAEELFWTGAGALALGDPESARLALDALPPVDALGALLAGRYALATDDTAPAQARFDALTPEILEAYRAAGPEAWTPWQDALLVLADALRNAVHDSELHGLRNLAAQPAQSPKVVRLPMAGATSPLHVTWTGYLMRGGAGAAPAGSPPGRLAPWASLIAGAVDEGWAGWRRDLADALDHGPAGRGSWDPIPDPWGPAASGAGIVLATLAFGVLGLDPDAPSGRLEMAPRLPAHVRSFRANGIRVGDAFLSLEYQREGGTHRFRLEPEGGRVPVMAILAPLLPISAVAEARVDGAAADLEVTPEEGGSRVQIQLPLDAPRSLEVDEA